MFTKAALLSIIISCHLSCSSLTSRHQIVSIDSVPRGAEIYQLNSESDEYLGKTPFFYKVSRARKLKFKAKYNNKSYFYDRLCSFRWLTTSVGNIPFFINPYAGIAAVSYDVASENAWACADYIVMNMKKKPKNLRSQKNCHKFFVVPPYLENKLDSFDLLDKWLKKAKSSNRGCSKFVPRNELMELHEIFNIGLHSRFEFQKLEKHKLRKIGLETGADIFVVLNIKKDSLKKGKIAIESVYYDMHTKQIKRGLSKTIYVAANRRFTGPSSKLFNYSIDFLPNSISYEARTMSFPKDRYKGSRTENRTLPSQLTAWNILSVSSPEAYNDWDISYGIYPSLELFLFDWSYNNLNGNNEPFRWRLYHLMGTYEGRVTLFNALGQSSVGLGLGAMVTYSEPSLGEEEMYINRVTQIYARHSAHFTRNLFAYMDISSYLPTKIFVAKEFNSGAFTDLSIGLGYYFPDAYSSLTSWIRAN